MKTAIITVAGISSRFNEEIPEQKKALKAIYSVDDPGNTLLYHLLDKCRFADRIIIVGGYKFDDLMNYCENLGEDYRNKTVLVFNPHYKDLASGYSLYLGLQKAFDYNAEEVLFVEGDLDIDTDSFKKVVESEKSVLTYTFEPIYAHKAVVLFRDEKGHYQYAFNSDHGLLSIDSPFSCILNSGQIWKFSEIDKLRKANLKFYRETKDGTNLRIIQNYLDMGIDIDLIPLQRWTNCNTKDDYNKILTYWEDNK